MNVVVEAEEARSPAGWRRVGRAVALAGLAVLLVTIYVHKQLGRRRQPASESAGTGRLRLLTFWNEPFKTAFEELLAEYAQGHPGRSAAQEAVPASGTGNLTDMLKMQLQAGDPPDLFIMAAGELAGPFIDADQVVPLDEAYKRYRWEEILTPWAVAAIRRHGKIWGVPFSTRAVAFWYRTDLFAKYGLAPPTSYAGLEAACRTLKANGVACLSMGGKFGWNTMRLVDYFLELTCGPALHDQLNRREVSWNRPEVVKAFSLLRRWIDEGWILPGFLLLSPNDARMPWYRGQAALVLEGDWIENVIKDDEQPGERFDFFLPPTDHEPLRFSAFVQQLMIPAASRHKEQAMAFLDWYSRPEVQRRYYTRLAASTATVGILPDPQEWPRQYRWRPILDKAATYPPTDQVFKAELMDGWFQVQDALVAGSMRPEEAAVKMHEVMIGGTEKPAAGGTR